MRRFFILLGFTLSCLSFGQVDWKLTAITNAVTDLRQTCSFRYYGVRELNPIYNAVGQKELPAAFFISFMWYAWQAEKKPSMWRDLAIAQIATVFNNGRLIPHGIPVLVIRF